MAVVRHLQHKQLELRSRHTETQATWSLVEDHDGERYLQIDTYGSRSREIRGKQSQSIRFSSEAISALKKILGKHFK